MSKDEKPHEFLVLIGKNVAKYRKKRKLSLEKLGLEIGLTRTHVHRIEKGYNITTMTILKLGLALKVEPYKLLQVGYLPEKDELQLLIKPKQKKQPKKEIKKPKLNKHQ